MHTLESMPGIVFFTANEQAVDGAVLRSGTPMIAVHNLRVFLLRS